jgi:hypothetical protein
VAFRIKAMTGAVPSSGSMMSAHAPAHDDGGGAEIPGRGRLHMRTIAAMTAMAKTSVQAITSAAVAARLRRRAVYDVSDARDAVGGCVSIPMRTPYHFTDKFFLKKKSRFD